MALLRSSLAQTYWGIILPQSFRRDDEISHRIASAAFNRSVGFMPVLGKENLAYYLALERQSAALVAFYDIHGMNMGGSFQ